MREVAIEDNFSTLNLSPFELSTSTLAANIFGITLGKDQACLRSASVAQLERRFLRDRPIAYAARSSKQLLGSGTVEIPRA